MDYTLQRSGASLVGDYDDGKIVDLGSAGEFGSYERKRTVKLPKGKVGVIGFTLAPPTILADYCAAGESAAATYFAAEFAWTERCNEDGTPKAGQQSQLRLDPNALFLTFSESTTQAKGDFHLWLSETKDGDPIEGCGFSTFPEGQWPLSVGVADGDTDKQACNLAEGGTYFMMVAFCATSADDISCKADDAETALRDGNMSLNPGWYRTE